MTLWALQNHVCTNQLKRQDDELKRVREEKEGVTQTQREVSDLLRMEQRKLMEAQSEMKETSVMQRLKYTEALQTIADLKQQLLSLESKVVRRKSSSDNSLHEDLITPCICRMLRKWPTPNCEGRRCAMTSL